MYVQTYPKFLICIFAVPICPAEHYFLSFKRIDEIANKKLPAVRDYDNHIYLRRIRDSFLMGAFEQKARPWKLQSGIPKKHKPGEDLGGLSPELSEEQWYHMLPFITSATTRMPILKEAEYDTYERGLDILCKSAISK